MTTSQDTPAGFSPDDLTDAGLRRLAKTFRRQLEDIEDGDLNRAAASVQRRLTRIEQIQASRAALTECWLASEDGTDSSADFEMGDSGRRVMRTDRGPSYKLATLFDYERHLRGESTVLAWEKAA